MATKYGSNDLGFGLRGSSSELVKGGIVDGLHQSAANRDAQDPTVKVEQIDRIEEEPDRLNDHEEREGGNGRCERQQEDHQAKDDETGTGSDADTMDQLEDKTIVSEPSAKSGSLPMIVSAVFLA